MKNRRKKNLYSIVRVASLAVALTSMVVGAPLWVQYALNMLSPLVWSISTRMEEDG